MNVALTKADLPVQVVAIMSRSLYGGEQVQMRFPNGYGASVVNHAGSYGTELAVLHGYEDEDDLDARSLCYATPITSDVVKHIADKAALLTIIENIAALPENASCDHERPADYWDNYSLGDALAEGLNALNSMSRMARR